MSKAIKGITIEIDGSTQGLQKALGDVNKQSRDITKELREVDKLLKFNPGNTELIAQKQKLLSDQIGTTSEKLQKLRDAQEEVNRQFEKGEISEEQYRGFQREIVETESKLKHYEGQLKSLSDTHETLGDKVAKAGEKLKGVGDKVSGLGTKLSKGITGPALAAGGGILALATKAGQAADRILDLTEITGLSSDSIQEWGHVATVAGVDTETMTKAVEGLVRKIPQLETEGGKATESLNKLGLEFSTLSELSPDEQMDAIIYALADMEDPLERNAIGAQLFGGAWKDVAPILGMGADEIANARVEAHELGNVLSEDSLNAANEFRIGMDKAKETIKATALQVGADLAPVLSETLVPIITEKVIPGIKSMIEWVAGAIEWYKNLSPEIQTAIAILGGFVVAIGPVLVIVGKLITIIGTVMTAFKTAGVVIAAINAPIAIAIAAIAAIIAIGITLYKNWDTIKEKAQALWQYLKQKFTDIKDAILRPVNDAIDTLKNINLVEIGKNIIGGLVNGIKSMVGSVKSVVSDITNTVTGGVKRALRIQSPSKVMEEMGEYTGEGFAIGIKNSLKEVDKQTKAMSLSPVGVGATGAGNSINHSGVIRVEGVNNAGELSAVVDIVMDQLRREVRA